MDEDVSFSSIAQAAGVLRGVAHLTPVMTNRELDAAVAGNVFLKCENFQRTGAFKFRGAYNALSHIRTLGSPNSSVVTISSGNHGQGIALAASLLGFSAHVVMPKPISSIKHRAIAEGGGQISITGNRTSAEETVRKILAQERSTYVHAFNDPWVIAGQGTVMLELFEQVNELDVLLAPVGGGGLLAGLCVAGHHLQPALKIFACEPSGASDAAESIRLNKIVPMANPHTLADGLRTSLGSKTLPILRAHLSGVLDVTEDEILTAMRFGFERLNW